MGELQTARSPPEFLSCRAAKKSKSHLAVSLQEKKSVGIRAKGDGVTHKRGS